MSGDAPSSRDPFAEIDGATTRLLRTLDAVPADQWSAPSVLPGWSRADVAAHLALNAEGLAGVLIAAASGSAAPMYASQAARDRDIEVLAADGAGGLALRTRAAAGAFHDALRAMPREAWSGTFERVPDGPPTALSAVPSMRLSEVQIHHADLGLGFGPQDWPVEFCRDVVEASVAVQAGAGPFRVTATDLGHSWVVGDGPGTAEVRGAVADLAWWLVGRGTGAELECNGQLPELGTWPRPAAPA